MDFLERRKYLILILLLASVLLFLNLGKPDMVGDQAHYSFRSAGYMDYLVSTFQTTPLQWFGKIPWWSKLSFHDHPPLVFILQFLSMKIFGVSAFGARFPSALAGLLTVLFIYLIGKELYSERVGLLSALVLTVSNFWIWISRTALLEPVMIFFIVLSIYFFIKSWSNSKYLYLWGISLGLAFISKYIAFYLIPVYFLFIFFKKKGWLKDKRFWLSLFLVFLICSPVIIYNLMMYWQRGHFDMQFGILLGQGNNDWPIIQTEPNFGFKGFFAENFSALTGVYSLISLSLFLLSLSFFVYCKNNKHRLFILCLLLFAFIGVSFLRVNVRYLSVISVFLALMAGFFLDKLLNFKYKKTIIVLLFVLFSADLLFTANTNILPVSLSKKLELSRPTWIGYNKLDEYFQEKFQGKCSNYSFIRSDTEEFLINEFRRKDCAYLNLPMIIYDDKMDWFETIWIFDKLKVYQAIAAAHASYLKDIIKDAESTVEKFKVFPEIYLVSLENSTNIDKYSSGIFDSFKKKLLEQKPDLRPDVIKGYDGSVSFKIYKLDN